MVDGVGFVELNDSQMIWNGSLITSLGNHEHEEILWELAKLSFV